MTDNTNIIKEASQRNTLKDLVDGAYAAIQLGEIESARVMLKSALALIEKSEVMYGVNDKTDPGIYEINKHRYVAENHCVKHGFGNLNVAPVLVIPLEQEQSE